MENRDARKVISAVFSESTSMKVKVTLKPKGWIGIDHLFDMKRKGAIELVDCYTTLVRVLASENWEKDSNRTVVVKFLDKFDGIQFADNMCMFIENIKAA